MLNKIKKGVIRMGNNKNFNSCFNTFSLSLPRVTKLNKSCRVLFGRALELAPEISKPHILCSNYRQLPLTIH